jgi:hypothetical protein
MRQLTRQSRSLPAELASTFLTRIARSSMAFHARARNPGKVAHRNFGLDSRFERAQIGAEHANQ